MKTRTAHYKFLLDIKSDELNAYLEDNYYGNDIKCFNIGIVLIKTRPGFEDWYKERKPRYTEHRIIKNRLTGQLIEVNKKFSYDVKFDGDIYDKVVNSSEDESLKIVSREIVNSLRHFDKLSKKIKDFDRESFKHDIQSFFINKGLIR